jgi:hypothetical protein
MVNPIDKVINRKKAVENANKEIKRRKNISRKTRGKTRKRKEKNKFKKRKKKKVTTTQVAQPPIRLSNKDGDKLEVNIVAKERRKKRKPKTFAEKRAEELRQTGIADPSILKQQQKVASEILGYRTQTRDPIALRDRRGRYNVEGGVSGFQSVSGRYTDVAGKGQRGIRTGVQSDAVGRDALIDEIEKLNNEKELKKQSESRRKRQPNFRTFGTQTKKGDDDDDDDDTPPPPPNVKRRGRTSQPEPQPEPEPQAQSRLLTPPPQKTRAVSTFTSPLSVTDRGTSPAVIPAPLPRRTPPEEYFAGRLRQDTPVRFRPINLPDVPPQVVDEDTDEEIAGITGGDSPEQVGIQPISPPQQPQGDPTPEPFDPDDEGFATPTLTDSQVQFPAPRPESRKKKDLPSAFLRPSSREALEREGLTFRDTPVDIDKVDIGGGGSAFRRPKRRSPSPEPEPEPVVQSVRRGRGRPKGSKNKPRSDTPAILESTKDVVARADLKMSMVQIQRILKRRLGSFGAKDVDDIQSLGELKEMISAIGDIDAETSGLIQDYWQIRMQLGYLKKL